MPHAPELIALVCDMRESHAASEIARAVGISRNAVIGIWFRERQKRGVKPSLTRNGGHYKLSPDERRRRKTERERRRLARKAREPRKPSEAREPREPREPTRPRKARAPRRPHRSGVAAALAAVLAMPEPPMDECGSAGVPLLDLEPGSCRYPLGPTMAVSVVFCGAGAVRHTSYCARHLRRCYRPPEERAKRKTAVHHTTKAGAWV